MVHLLQSTHKLVTRLFPSVENYCSNRTPPIGTRYQCHSRLVVKFVNQKKGETFHIVFGHAQIVFEQILTP